MNYKDGIGGGRILEEPCTIEIERLFSTIGLMAKFKFLLNGLEVCRIKYKEIGVFTTSYEFNTLTIKGGGINKRYDFTAYPGYRMRVYNLGGAFLPNKTEIFPPEETSAEPQGVTPSTPQTVAPLLAPTARREEATPPVAPQTLQQAPQTQLASFCSKCGTPFQREGLFCSQCGAKRS